MSRKLFCEISPLTYKISTLKCRSIRHLRNWWHRRHLATAKQAEPLPFVIYKHKEFRVNPGEMCHVNVETAKLTGETLTVEVVKED